MAWQFSDQALEREARRLARLVSGLALFTAALVLFGVSGGYFWSRYDEERSDAAGELLNIQFETLNVVDWSTVDDAHAVKHTLDQVLMKTLRADGSDGSRKRFVVYGPNHLLLAELGTPPAWPVLRLDQPIDPSIPKLGTVVVEHSLMPVMQTTGAVTLFAVIGAATVLFFFRSIPMRVFRRAMIRLDQAQHARAEAEQGLREHLVELERTKNALQESAERLQTALEDAAESSEAKSQFLASMSHELRTPLNAIIGFSEIMDRGMFGEIDNERYCEYVDLILNSARHLLSLVNEILDLSKAGAGKLELYEGEIDLATMVRNIYRTMQPAATNAQITLVANIPARLPSLRADPQRFTQVLLNLVSNAIKFNIAGGTVRITAEYHRVTGMKIEVGDTGIGIAPEDIPKALERFGQVEDSFTRRYQGTGLGLPISKKLIELHGGTLGLQSALGVGTTVTVWLPPERIIRAATDPKEDLAQVS